MVDEAYQHIGVGTYLCEMLARLIKVQQLKRLTADVFIENIKMHYVFKKMDWSIKVKWFGGINRLTLDF